MEPCACGYLLVPWPINLSISSGVDIDTVYLRPGYLLWVVNSVAKSEWNESNILSRLPKRRGLPLPYTPSCSVSDSWEKGDPGMYIHNQRSNPDRRISIIYSPKNPGTLSNTGELIRKERKWFAEPSNTTYYSWSCTRFYLWDKRRLHICETISGVSTSSTTSSLNGFSFPVRFFCL